jgi:hypothetical protein
MVEYLPLIKSYKSFSSAELIDAMLSTELSEDAQLLFVSWYCFIVAPSLTKFSTPAFTMSWANS